MECWSCQKPWGEKGLLCAQCGVPQPVHPLNPFALLGLEPVFRLDLGDVERAYFALQRQIHPDRFVTADPKARALAQEGSTLLNAAYETVKDPLKRARTLYAIVKAETLPEASQNPQVLEDMMTLQELLLEDAELGECQVREQLETCVEALENAFTKNLDAVPGLLERFSYLRRLEG